MIFLAIADDYLPDCHSYEKNVGNIRVRFFIYLTGHPKLFLVQRFGQKLYKIIQYVGGYFRGSRLSFNSENKLRPKNYLKFY